MKSEHFIYTNRYGKRYYLCEVATKAGKRRLVFASAPRGDPVPAVPEHHEVVESVRGQVSLRRRGSSPILEREVALVEVELSRHVRLRSYRAEARKKDIVVLEASGTDFGALAEKFGVRMLSPSLGLRPTYSPVLRFRLVDPEERRFAVQRMCYRGSIDGWLSLHDAGPLPSMAARYIPHLGRDSFFELF